MATGIIKSLVSNRGFGFISVEGMEKDLFFHSKDMTPGVFETLAEGQKLSFDINTEGAKGAAAVNVQVV